MTEAMELLQTHFDVSRGTSERLSSFVDLLSAENGRQNLVSRGSLDHVWSRHILDSAQLLHLAPRQASSWIDLGTGAGFPGLVVAALGRAKVTMVEARPRRVEFLRAAAELLQLPEATCILCSKVERLGPVPFEVISARAFAPLDRLFQLGARFAAPETQWVLPRGKNVQSELDHITGSWHGEFRVERSLTDPDAGILIASKVCRKRGSSVE